MACWEVIAFDVGAMAYGTYIIFNSLVIHSKAIIIYVYIYTGSSGGSSLKVGRADSKSKAFGSKPSYIRNLILIFVLMRSRGTYNMHLLLFKLVIDPNERCNRCRRGRGPATRYSWCMIRDIYFIYHAILAAQDKFISCQN
jgi:hypothetical protein